MANLQKYNQRQLGHLLKHIERAKDDFGNYVKFSNQSIDLDRTYLNYELHNRNDGLNNYEFITGYAEKNNILKRKDVNYLCNWVVTLPDSLKTAPAEEQRKFFEESYSFIGKRYGMENVAFATVHNDETTPHMHLGFVPVVYDKTKDRTKVSAKEVVTREDLQTFHQDLDRHMTQAFGKNIGVLTSDVSKYDKAPSKSIKQLKIENHNILNTNHQLKENNQRLKAQISDYNELLKEMDIIFDELNNGDKKYLESFNLKDGRNLYQGLLDNRASRGVEPISDIQDRIKQARNQVQQQSKQSDQQKQRDSIRTPLKSPIKEFKDKDKVTPYKQF